MFKIRSSDTLCILVPFCKCKQSKQHTLGNAGKVALQSLSYLLARLVRAEPHLTKAQAEGGLAAFDAPRGLGLRWASICVNLASSTLDTEG